MARVDLLDLTEAPDEDVREFAPTVTGPDGRVGAHFAAEAHFPPALINTYETRLAIARERDLGARLFTKLAVAVSMANECTYCTGAYATQLSAQLGGEEAAREFQLAVAEGELEGKAADVVGFGLRILADPHDATDADVERLREEYGFTDRTLVALIYAVNVVDGYNRLTVTTDLAYDHDYPREWADPDSLPEPVGAAAAAD